MIKVKFLGLNSLNNIHLNFSKNNDGIYGDVQWFGCEANDCDVDYIIMVEEYVYEDKQALCDPKKLWYLCGEVYTYPAKPIFHRPEFEKTLSYVGDKIPKGEFLLFPTPTWFDNISRTYLENRKIQPKPKKLGWITSNKCFSFGHKKRMQMILKLKKAGIVDLYGSGFEYVETKIDCLEQYKYTISMENNINEKNWITEKLSDCFMARTLPFYFGTDEVLKYFPEKSMIRFDPDDKFLVEKITEIINSDLYLERMDYIEEARNLALDKYNTFEQISKKISQHHKQNPTGEKQQIFVKGKDWEHFRPFKRYLEAMDKYYNWRIRNIK